MARERMRRLLAELNRELHSADDFDAETRALLKHLNDELDEITSESDDVASARDAAKKLHSRFAASHPTAAQIARDLVDALAKMGI